MNLLEMTFKEVSQLLNHRFGRGDFHSGALLREVIKRGNHDFWQAPEFERSQSMALALASDYRHPDFTVVDQVEEENTLKFVTRLHDGCLIESVVVPMKRYNTLCVSTQAGCRMGCRFCETARSGFKRNLRVDEITGQLFSARITLGKKISNIVFMGMGEPFDNFDNLVQSIRVFNDQKGFDVALRHMTVSTCGLVSGIRALAGLDFSQLSLAVSVHSAVDGVRSSLMPVNLRYPLAELRSALEEYPLHKRRYILVEYVLIRGVNDSQEAASALVQYLAPLKVRVNLIGYNPGRSHNPDQNDNQNDGQNPEFQGVDDDAINRFAGWLENSGLFVIKRWSKGQSLMAGCGQLSAKQITTDV
ncbi:MAG: 23S rRNA (adenine(2503)-C(2))-methyltransferase RlmN [Desulfobacterium sp.]|nr:23S rRNA (adenine(2503)-C(2))-methyltransferase RlmN [Desulfobacterium sp.]